MTPTLTAAIDDLVHASKMYGIRIHRDGGVAAIDQVAARVDDARATLEREIASLVVRYGKHEANCLGDISGRRPCTCGLSNFKLAP